MSVVCPCRVQRLDSALMGALQEDVSNRLVRCLRAGAGRKLEHLGMIERVFDADRRGGARIRRVGSGRYRSGACD